MKTKKIPQRMCIGCRQMKPKGELIRIVKGEDNVFLDFSGKSPGRGAYICKNSECLQKAEKLRAIEHSFKCRVDRELYSALSKELDEQNE